MNSLARIGLVAIILAGGLGQPTVMADEKPQDGNEGEHTTQESDSDVIETAKDIVQGIDKLFGGTQRAPGPPGAQLQFRAQDWAGRPVDGKFTLRGSGGALRTITTTASFATMNAVTPGRYQVELEPVRGVAPPSRHITVENRSDRLLIVLTALRPRPQIRLQGRRDALPRTPPLKTSPNVQPRLVHQPAARNLAEGDRLVCQGRVLDVFGRPTDATIRVFQGVEELGYVHTTAGMFSLYDLGPGRYRWVASAPGLTETSGSFSVGNGLSRPTVRVRRR